MLSLCDLQNPRTDYNRRVTTQGSTIYTNKNTGFYISKTRTKMESINVCKLSRQRLHCILKKSFQKLFVISSVFYDSWFLMLFVFVFIDKVVYSVF